MNGKLNGRGGHQGQGGRVRGRASIWNSYYRTTTKNKGLCSFLVNHVFDYSQKASEDQMKTK